MYLCRNTFIYHEKKYSKILEKIIIVISKGAKKYNI